MTYKMISEYNMSDFSAPFSYVNDILGGIAMPIVLFVVWSVFCLGSYFIQKNATGMGDFPASMALAGFVTTILAFMFRLIPGLINGFTLAVCLIVAVISVLFFLFSRD